MDKDELSLEDLENVGTNYLSQLRNFYDAYEKGNSEKVVELGYTLLASKVLDENQIAEVSKMINEAKNVLNNSEKHFSL